MATTSVSPGADLSATCEALAVMEAATKQADAIDRIRVFEKAKAVLESARARETAALE